jgi:phosphate acetyltransferase
MKAIYIAATGQNVGKTTLSLGILAALKKRYEKIGFIKPVGQRHVAIDASLNVDKDTYLFKEYFHLKEGWSEMSPVIIPSGFTKKFLNDEVTEDNLLNHIQEAFKKVSVGNDFTIVEGTGHVGVGSIINLSNAQVAKALGLDIVIIVSAGLGSAFDEISLNLAMCEKYQVNVKGIILNRVKDEKREMLLKYFPKALKRWNIPLIGCVPFNNLLSNPSMKDFEILFNAPLLSGHQALYRHFEHSRLVAGSLASYESEILQNELIITPASRDDIILRVIEEHKKHSQQGGLILTGRQPPHENIITEIKKNRLPVIYAPLCSYDAMKMITSFTAKIAHEDSEKIVQAIELVEQNVNFDILCS